MNRFARTLSLSSLAACLTSSASLALTPTPALPQLSAPTLSLETEQEPLRYQKKLHLPNLGVHLLIVKDVDPLTGHVTGQTTNAAGTPVDLAALLQEEAALRRITPGAKFAPGLTRAFEADPSATLPVVLWLDYDADAIDEEAARNAWMLHEESTSAEMEVREAATTAFALKLIENSNAAALSAVTALGIDVRYVSTSAPVIFVDASLAESQALEALPEVDTLYLESFDAEDTNNSASRAHRANTTFNSGWRGAGVRVAVLENNGIDPDCPHLDVEDWFNADNPNPDDHVHGTAGCLASRLATRRGHAPDVTLFSANAASYSDANITQAGDWIIDRNISVTNMSFGGNNTGNLQYLDRYFDYQSRTFQDSYVASSGNSGSWVGSPGKAWNCVTVGNFDDFNSTTWGDDAMANSSSWRNPFTGCEKPNLSATGQRIDTIGMGPDWLRNNYSGTSFSSPFTAGSLAVTMSRDGTANFSPEAAMAAAMASAWNNIEGSSRLSDLDGAGGLSQRASARMGNRNGIRSITVNSGSFNNNGFRTYNVWCTGGDRTRIAIAWSARANASYNDTTLSADLDITIIRGSNQTTGTSLGSSSSADNNFEIVEFTPPANGTYTIRINDWSFNGTTERVGIAWSQRNRDQGN